MPDDAFGGGAAIVAVRLTCANPCIANDVQPAIKIPPVWQPHVPGSLFVILQRRPGGGGEPCVGLACMG